MNHLDRRSSRPARRGRLLGAVLGLALAGQAPAPAHSTESKVNQQVGLYITFWAAPGKADELLKTVQNIMATAQQEKGTLVYGINTVAGDRPGVSVFEIYANAEAQAEHGRSKAIEALKAALPGLISAPPEARPFTPVPGAKGMTN